MKDLIDIDGSEDDMKDDRLSNKPLDESFYLILLLSVYNYLDYTDFFILIRSKEVGKGAMAVITVMPVTAGTPLAATAETAAMPGKGAMAVIAAIPVTAGTPLAATAETAAMLGKGAMAVKTAMPITVGTLLAATAETAATPRTRSDQIDPSKDAGNTSGLKVRFCDNVIVIKKSSDIDIIVLNDKTTMLRTTTLEAS